MDRFDQIVWQDREVKFDISNVYVEIYQTHLSLTNTQQMKRIE